MFDWDFAVLEALYSLGGEASIQETRQALKQRGGLQKAKLDQSWEGQVPRRISRLRLEGYLSRQARGRYSLTHQGWQRFVNELALNAPESPILQKERSRKSLVLDVEVEALDEGGFLASCPAIQGCHAEGNTVGESIENLEDVARTFLELFSKQDWPMPRGLEEYKTRRHLAAQIVVPLP